MDVFLEGYALFLKNIGSFPFGTVSPITEHKSYYFHLFFFKKSNVVYHQQLVSLSVSELLKTFSSLKLIPPTKDETVLPQELSKDS